DDEDDSTEQAEEIIPGDVVQLVRKIEEQGLRNKKMSSYTINENNEIKSGDDWLLANNDNCPHCNAQNTNPIHFRVSSAFTNRILSDIILDQTQVASSKTAKTLYEGRKYISFTDSRQGTAKISALINIDSESDWIRYQTYHFLLKKLSENKADRSHDELIQERAYYLDQLEKAPPFLKKEIDEKLREVNDRINSGGETSLAKSRSTWKEIIEYLIPKV